MRTDRGTFSLRAKLVRMVMRVSPDLQIELIEISDRLFSETSINYSYAAIVRGLIALGLASLRGKENLAAEFAGARVPRGKKPGGGELMPDEWNQGGRSPLSQSRAVSVSHAEIGPP